MSNWRKIYVASSWRNEFQPEIVAQLRACGHMVYDFRHPTNVDSGYSWKTIAPSEKWENWSFVDYQSVLDHPVSEKAFLLDYGTMKWADTFVLVLPSGRSSHLELGWACGAGKFTAVLMMEAVEPELMYKMADCICYNMTQVVNILR